jgi:hypothetical protein
MRRHHSLRASDADRDAVVDRLREAAGEGRLDPEELGDRVGAALHARTYGDLAALIADLPGNDQVLSPLASSRTNAAVRCAIAGGGLLIAVTLAFALVAVVAMLVIAAAAWWIAVVLFWLVCCGSRRRLAWGPIGPRSLIARHANRARSTGSL